MNRTIRLAYRGHSIVAAVLKGKLAAQIYVGTTMATRERFKGSTVEEAPDRARAWVDARRAAAISARRAPCIGTVDEYEAYFVTATTAPTALYEL